jgi:hypothetical protein
MKSKQIGVCCALTMALSLMIGNNEAQALSCGKVVEAIPETTFSDATAINKFDSICTEGYPPKQLTLKSGNGVADFVQSPGYLEDQPPWYFTPNSSQIAADGSTSYTKVIPFGKNFHVRFHIQIVNPSQFPTFSQFGGIVFELHDTDPVFAKYGDPSHSAIQLYESNGSYTFYVNNTALWTAPLTLKTWDVFELNGVLQEGSSTVNDGKLELKRNGVVVATSTGANCNSMTPYYPSVPGTPPTPLGPPPHPLTSGPHVRLGLGHVPSASGPTVPPTVTEVYIDNVHAVYRE